MVKSKPNNLLFIDTWSNAKDTFAVFVDVDTNDVIEDVYNHKTKKYSWKNRLNPDTITKFPDFVQEKLAKFIK